MNLQSIIDTLELTPLTGAKDFSRVEITAGYSSDLLSCVMAGAAKGGVWVTLQAHANIVAVAALLELGAVIITEDAQPDMATIAKAEEEGLTLLATPVKSFEVVGRLWEMGLRSN